MKYKTLLLVVATSLSGSLEAQNQMIIPGTLTGPNYSLTLQEGTNVFYPGITTNTMGANGNLLGPTLMMNKGDNISITVNNQLTDTTTIHWHGMHVAPENDGGPHSVINPGTTWNPQFEVMDKAGLHWYHPHLHMMTDKHVSKGIAGLIIVRDTEEAGLNLPVSYGVDEFPIILQTKGFDLNGQIEVHTEMDTSVLVNGTPHTYTDLPAQVVRLRVLNGASQRVFELGFSDNRQFSLIGTDGGLLTAPVNLTRYRMAPGQRADILVDLSSSQGQSLQLMNFGSELPNAIYGSIQPGMGPGATIPGYANNPLNGSDFAFLDINVVAPTANPITTIPTSLATFTTIPEASATTTRTLTFTSAGQMGNLVGPFLINGAPFEMSTINYTVPLNNTEIWTLVNQTPIAHPFHIHDVQFFILDINGNPPPPALAGYNDVVLVPAGMGQVRFIAKFEDFANDSIPYMYHCHMLTHEDMGMMGQFIVSDASSGLAETQATNVRVYPNPNDGKMYVEVDEKGYETYEIIDLQGKQIENGKLAGFGSSTKIQIDAMSGMYWIKLSGANKDVVTQRFIIQ